jgi:hypothetical protein
MTIINLLADIAPISSIIIEMQTREHFVLASRTDKKLRRLVQERREQFQMMDNPRKSALTKHT